MTPRRKEVERGDEPVGVQMCSPDREPCKFPLVTSVSRVAPWWRARRVGATSHAARRVPGGRPHESYDHAFHGTGCTKGTFPAVRNRGS